MQTAELVLEYIKALVYPGIILAALLLFRREFANLLTGKFTAKYKDLEITLERTEKAFVTLRENQKVALTNLEREVSRSDAPAADPQAITTRTPTLLREYIHTLSTTLGEYENLIIGFLRERRGLAKKHDIIHELTKDSDHWRADREARWTNEALQKLLDSSIVSSGPDDYIRLHDVFLYHSDASTNA